MPITSRRKRSARSQSGHMLASSARPPPSSQAAGTLTHTPVTAAVHRCPARAAWTQSAGVPRTTSTQLSQEGGAPHTQGACAPRGTCSSWERALLETQQSRGWETLPPTCPKAAEGCARGQHRRHQASGRREKQLGAWSENQLGTPDPQSGPPRQRWHLSRLDTPESDREDSGPEQGSSANVANLSPEYRRSVTLTLHSPRFHPHLISKLPRRGFEIQPFKAQVGVQCV